MNVLVKVTRTFCCVNVKLHAMIDVGIKPIGDASESKEISDLISSDLLHV